MSEVLGDGVSAVGLDVGFLCQGPPGGPGGVEASLRELARGLVARGHRAHFLVADRDGDGAPYSTSTREEDGLQVRRMVAPRELGSFGALVDDPRSDDVVLAWLAETPCDLIHVHHVSGFGASALRAIADMGRPLAVSLHDAWLLCPCGRPLHALGDAHARLACARQHWASLLPSGGGAALGPGGRALEDDEQAVEARRAFALECLGLAQRLCVPSPSALETCVEGGIARERLEVVEPGLDAAGIRARVAAARAQRTPAANEPSRLGVIGVISPEKGVVELIEAFREAAVPGLALEVHGPLVPAHGETAHLERVRELAAGCAGVTLHGAFAPDDLARVLASLDALAAPSTWPEFFGMAVREARAAGLPVLVSERGALAAAAQGGAAGRVLPAGDRAAWVAALRELAADADLRARWAAAPVELREGPAMALDHERRYLELVLEVTGRLPELAIPVEGLQPERAPAPAAEPAPKRKGLLGRLFGG